jgi:hypothetical protein
MQVFKNVEATNQEWVAKKVNEAIGMLNQNMRKSVIANINHDGVQKRITQANAGLQQIADTKYQSSASADAVIDNLYYRILDIFKKMADHFDAQ